MASSWTLYVDSEPQTQVLVLSGKHLTSRVILPVPVSRDWPRLATVPLVKTGELRYLAAAGAPSLPKGVTW